MERALKLFAEGNIMLKDINIASKKPAKTPIKLNKATGKDSSAPLAFSEINWGHATRAYMKSINRHGNDLVVSISNLAHNIVLKRRGPPINDDEFNDNGSEDERAMI
ncbi:hypothetical protein BV22DRAFT_1016024 [Leucogyrophana mollusca]|uniref:Uncharacterized protein n=1 Tax=Leucogyrophana mollusca TaxID=85980 RepID=A0ACB8BCH0_9AGAM|nr:hypothetical protein BV22DRAFT_1016024 [Leucogyrophana mollusca]